MEVSQGDRKLARGSYLVSESIELLHLAVVGPVQADVDRHAVSHRKVEIGEVEERCVVVEAQALEAIVQGALRTSHQGHVQRL